jgi:hypothetical protein
METWLQYENLGRKIDMSRDDNENPKSFNEEASSELEEFEVLPPETTEDFLVLALEKSGVEEVVRLLRDWCGSKEIRRVLDGLHHKDPVDRFTHTRRRAVELYAELNDITPANLMVNLTGVNGRKEASGSERYKLRMARKYLENDEDARIAAIALADKWEKTRNGRDAIFHLKDINRQAKIFPTEV